MDFNLVSFDCDGFMTKYGFSMNDMMRDEAVDTSFCPGYHGSSLPKKRELIAKRRKVA